MPTGMAEDNFIFFMHPDHLGSTSFVTDRDGGLYEHVAYFPFGETWVEQASDTEDIPYLFTGKEFDSETGLYYFGARYYDPRTSVWESADPALLSSFTPKLLSAYSYAFNNPVRLTDPTGMVPDGLKSPDQKKDEQFAGEQIVKGAYNSIVRAAVGELQRVAIITEAAMAVSGTGVAGEVSGQLDAVEEATTFNNVSPVYEVIGGLYVAAAGNILAEVAESIPLARALAGKPADPSITVRPATDSELLEVAKAVRDELADALGKTRHPPATVVGGYSSSTGEVATGVSRGAGRGCAEGACAEALGNPADAKFTKAVRPRTGRDVPVCEPCEATHGRDAFPEEGTRFKSDEDR